MFTSKTKEMVSILEKINYMATTPEATAVAIKLLIESFTEDCLDEINKMKRENEADVFNYGLGSADAAVRRIKTKYIERLNNQINQQ